MLTWTEKLKWEEVNDDGSSPNNMRHYLPYKNGPFLPLIFLFENPHEY